MSKVLMTKRKMRKRIEVGAIILLVSSSATSTGLLSQKSSSPIPRRLSFLQRRLSSARILKASSSSSSSSSFEATGSSKNDTDEEMTLSRRRAMSVALTASYFTVMGAKCALPSVLSLLTSPKTGLRFGSITTTSSNIGRSPQGAFSRLLFLATLAVALGKLLLGPIIDHFGGILSLQVALSSLAAFLAVITFSDSFGVFSVAWIFVDFIFSSCWAACINAIHQSFPEHQWAGQVARLAAAARTGNAVAFAFFASLLQFLDSRMRQPWRAIFAVSALLQLIPLTLLTIFGRNPAVQTEKSEKSGVMVTRRTPLTTLRREAATPDFWLHLLSRSVLMVFASFLLFVPTLMSEVYSTSHAFASQTGSIYALGCLLSVTTGSQLYARLSKKRKAGAVFGLLGLATLSSVAQWGHMVGKWCLSPWASTASLFLWGWSFAIPFYIPPSLYALERGGVESSATIADVFDVVGFAFLAAFNGYVAGISHNVPSAWIPTFQITTACSLLSLVALTTVNLRD